MNFRLACFICVAFTFGGCANLTSSTSDAFIDIDGYTNQIVKSGVKNPAIKEVLYQTKFTNVLLVDKEPNSPENQHPAKLQESVVKSALLSMQTQKHQEDDPAAFFEKDEIKLIVPYLTQALNKATPNQEVVFFLPQRREFVGILKSNFLTTARVFVQDNQLNLIFGNILYDYEIPFRKNGFLDYIKPGSRSENVTNHWKILKNERVSLVANRENWVQITLVDETTPAQGKKTLPVAPVAPDQLIEKRLQTLENLKQKGLLNDQEYQEKRKSILNSL